MMKTGGKTTKYKIIPIVLCVELVENLNSPIRRIRNADGTIRYARIPELKVIEIKSPTGAR